MSQKAVRASAREIRRAFGPAAVQVLDEQEEHIRQLASKIAWLTDKVAHGQVACAEVDALKPKVDALKELVIVTANQRVGSLEGFVHDSSFLGRLRWLFTGR